jgi:hypothetical protein
MANGLKNDSEP